MLMGVFSTRMTILSFAEHASPLNKFYEIENDINHMTHPSQFLKLTHITLKLLYWNAYAYGI